MNIFRLLIILVLLLIMYNISSALYSISIQHNNLEGFEGEKQQKINCAKPATGTKYDENTQQNVPIGWNTNCLPVSNNLGDKVKLCGGDLSPEQISAGNTANNCNKRWLVDSLGNVCSNSNLANVEKYGKCPTNEITNTSANNKGIFSTLNNIENDVVDWFDGNTSNTSSRSSQVPDDSTNHKYKKYIPNNSNIASLTRNKFEKIGRNYIKDAAKTRGQRTPSMSDVEAELVGKMVWRVYMAELEKKRVNSPKSHDDFMSREIQLLNKVSNFMSTGSSNLQTTKQQKVEKQASNVPERCSSKLCSQLQTTNMFNHLPPKNNDIKREEGKAFDGQPLQNTAVYYDITNAIEHCMREPLCGGVNYNSANGKYILMPKNSKLIIRPHFTAIVKNKQVKTGNITPMKTCDGNMPYVPITGLGYNTCKGLHPRNPNLMPRPYNSLMEMFR